MREQTHVHIKKLKGKYGERYIKYPRLKSPLPSPLKKKKKQELFFFFPLVLAKYTPGVELR